MMETTVEKPYLSGTENEIGYVIERHMQMLGMIKSDKLDEHQKEFIEKKKAELIAKQNASEEKAADSGEFPENSTVCDKCSTKAVVLMDGCMTCLSCGDAKCG